MGEVLDGVRDWCGTCVSTKSRLLVGPGVSSRESAEPSCGDVEDWIAHFCIVGIGETPGQDSMHTGSDCEPQCQGSYTIPRISG
jgi:hypothetical protein